MYFDTKTNKFVEKKVNFYIISVYLQLFDIYVKRIKKRRKCYIWFSRFFQ